MGRALIVSAGASSNEYIAARLAEMGYARPVILPSGAEARRRMPDADFDLIVVNAPLPDEFGHELCMDAVASTDAGVVFLVNAAQAERQQNGRESSSYYVDRTLHHSSSSITHANGGGGHAVVLLANLRKWPEAREYPCEGAIVEVESADVVVEHPFALDLFDACGKPLFNEPF